MSESPDFRSWAATNQAAKEHDASEVLRLMSIAEYWERLADLEDWQRDGLLPALGTKAQRRDF